MFLNLVNFNFFRGIVNTPYEKFFGTSNCVINLNVYLRTSWPSVFITPAKGKLHLDFKYLGMFIYLDNNFLITLAIGLVTARWKFNKARSKEKDWKLFSFIYVTKLNVHKLKSNIHLCSPFILMYDNAINIHDSQYKLFCKQETYIMRTKYTENHHMIRTIRLNKAGDFIHLWGII